MPKMVKRKIVNIPRNFLWGSREGSQRIPWVKWKQMCLGVKDSQSFNEALLGKWRWCLFHQYDSLWCRILESKYGGWKDIQDGESSHKSSIWWRVLLKVHWFEQGVEWKIEEGNQTRFWLDKWVGTQTLMEAFPRIFLVANMGSWVGDVWCWDLKWRRRRFGRETTQWEELELLLQDKPLQKGETDSWWWIHETNGIYSVNSAYKVIQNRRNNTHENPPF
uniref:Ribonuclease H protein At1g65750 family n=1 Tax=Cajanus cajan TaxID=3821 RepID=A0A151S5R5_CAJCA|nr:Putative ribonuclease H protein At1g65750 family [Cajanus cajan]